MIEVLVWLLISFSDGNSNRGNTQLIERFKTNEQCQHVLKNITERQLVSARCIQANIYIKKD